jgi:glycerol-1-phosphate dehydrogenase [NAD(P)+]
MTHGQNLSGVIGELVAGRWKNPVSGRNESIPIKSIVIADTLDGMEADLLQPLHPGKSICVVSDERTRSVLGERILRALQPSGNVTEYVWAKPRCTPEGVDELMAATQGSEALIAVGSGTISDSVKYGTHLTGREYSVFATSPMNAYTTPTASVSFEGFKKSITCHSAQGVFFDLGIVSMCPPRLIAAAFADVVCRTTAQVDWLLSHLLFNTPYDETAYILLAYDEERMMDNASKMNSDFEALATLTRISALMGLGTSFTGTTHVGSMAEHMISHYIDMFAGKNHPGTSHGEQVGVATLTMSRLQNQILNRDEPPVLRATEIPNETLVEKFGQATATTMVEQTARKALTKEAAEKLNERLAAEWTEIANKLRAVMLPSSRLYDSMKAAGCQLTGRDLGLEPTFYQDAVRYSRYIRDRFTMLDLAAESDQLEPFVLTCE